MKQQLLMLQMQIQLMQMQYNRPHTYPTYYSTAFKNYTPSIKYNPAPTLPVMKTMTIYPSQPLNIGQIRYNAPINVNYYD